MGLLHCPICIGLGLLSISQSVIWARLLWIVSR